MCNERGYFGECFDVLCSIWSASGRRWFKKESPKSHQDLVDDDDDDDNDDDQNDDNSTTQNSKTNMIQRLAPAAAVSRIWKKSWKQDSLFFELGSVSVDFGLFQASSLSSSWSSQSMKRPAHFSAAHLQWAAVIKGRSLGLQYKERIKRISLLQGICQIPCISRSDEARWKDRRSRAFFRPDRKVRVGKKCFSQV